MLTVEIEGSRFALTAEAVACLREWKAPERWVSELLGFWEAQGGVQQLRKVLVGWPCGCHANRLEVEVRRFPGEPFVVNVPLSSCRGGKGCGLRAELARQKRGLRV